MLPIAGVDCQTAIQKHRPNALDLVPPDLAGIGGSGSNRHAKKANSHPIASLVHLGPIREKPILNQSPELGCQPAFQVGRVHVTEPGLGRTEGRNHSRRWVKYAITLLLLVAVVLAAALSSRSRDAWWEKYLSYIVRS
jgi:hypothetical protein